MQLYVHSLQVKIFSPECISMCVLRLPAVVNALAQILQLWGFSPPLFRTVFAAEDIVQLFGFSLVDTIVHQCFQWKSSVLLASSALEQGSGLTREKSPDQLNLKMH